MDFKLKKSNLNFRVYTSETEPTAPGVENDIVVITSVPMTNWILSPDKPSGTPRTDGDVWIRYGVTGNTFNILKNDSMLIATIYAYQFVDGSWVDVTAKSYQNGEWVSWVLTLAPNPDKFGSEVWTKSGATITAGADDTKFVIISVIEGVAYALVKVDVGSFSKLKLTGVITDVSSSSGACGVYIGLFSALPVAYGDEKFITGYSNLYGAQNGKDKTVDNTYDISAVSGSVYLGIVSSQAPASKTHTTTYTMTSIELY